MSEAKPRLVIFGLPDGKRHARLWVPPGQWQMVEVTTGEDNAAGMLVYLDGELIQPETRESLGLEPPNEPAGFTIVTEPFDEEDGWSTADA